MLSRGVEDDLDLLERDQLQALFAISSCQSSQLLSSPAKAGHNETLLPAVTSFGVFVLVRSLLSTQVYFTKFLQLSNNRQVAVETQTRLRTA